MSIDKASAVMGKFARSLGPFIPVSSIAKKQLRQIFPNWPDEKIQAVIKSMWENMGCYFGELPHIGNMTREEFFERTEIIGAEHYHNIINSEKGSLFFSCHMANWEWGAKTAWALGKPFSIVYRPLNNPYAEVWMTDTRNHYQTAGIPKTSAGNRELLMTLRRGDPVAILIDQRMRTGVPIPFFGHDALTSTTIADLAIRYDYPIVPLQIERIKGTCRFRATFEPPIAYEKTGDSKHDALNLMKETHAIMERWITQHPEQWFWVHRRWNMKHLAGNF